MYRQREQVVQAIQWTGENLVDVQVFMRPDSPLYSLTPTSSLLGFYTPKHDQYNPRELTFIKIGDYIVKVGETFIPVGKDRFEQLYEQLGAPDGTEIIPEAEAAGRDTAERASGAEADRQAASTH